MIKWVMILLLLACVAEPEPAPVIEPPAVGPPQIVSELPPPVAKTPEPAVTVPTPDDTVGPFVNRSRRVTQYFYTNNLGKITHDVQSDLILIEYSGGFKGSNGMFFDRAFINRGGKAVVAWCVRYQCTTASKGKAYYIEYANHFKIRTPWDILHSLQIMSVDKNAERYFQKNQAHQITYIDEQGIQEGWLHAFYALPLSLTLDGILVEYREIGINPAIPLRLNVPEHLILEG